MTDPLINYENFKSSRASIHRTMRAVQEGSWAETYQNIERFMELEGYVFGATIRVTTEGFSHYDIFGRVVGWMVHVNASGRLRVDVYFQTQNANGKFDVLPTYTELRLTYVVPKEG